MIFQQKAKPGLSTKHQFFFFRLTKNHPTTIVFVVLGVLRSFNKDHVENTWVKYVTLLLMMEEKILGFHRLQFCAEYRNLCFGHQSTKREPDCSSTETVIPLSVTFREASSHLSHLWTFDTSEISKEHYPSGDGGQAPACFIYGFYELKTCARQK